eukprot:2567977-Prymnesium_polylepis.1
MMPGTCKYTQAQLQRDVGDVDGRGAPVPKRLARKSPSARAPGSLRRRFGELRNWAILVLALS